MSCLQHKNKKIKRSQFQPIKMTEQSGAMKRKQHPERVRDRGLEQEPQKMGKRENTKGTQLIFQLPLIAVLNSQHCGHYNLFFFFFFLQVAMPSSDISECL